MYQSVALILCTVLNEMISQQGDFTANVTLVTHAITAKEIDHQYYLKEFFSLIS